MSSGFLRGGSSGTIPREGNFALKPYLDCIRETLGAALCVSNFASQIVERHNKPEVEVGTSSELLLNPIVIRRSDHESVLIESAVNSVRFSIKARIAAEGVARLAAASPHPAPPAPPLRGSQVKQLDEMDEILARKFTRFLMLRADNFIVLRRKPVPGYDISFLLTNFNVEALWKHKLIDFVIQFMEEIDSEISAMKLAVNERARMVGYQYLREMC
ncbi:actin related protein 2/3 complex subunit 4 [Emiliania huxleyi CCMP1516]|uniref:Actin-related protein 2/3 complex subunit 4 n=2 Tax=Emiliania huxleyi TaxID=2903 RepID=A0A0D3L034_EMIH1|nr:actin related protein 2/3 complex subunit 4 [Emiliania huxleyi CCMP1516]EOD41369.1 actin related protein 2/3 complex subunit 4 [Emiliania huxleyi CCMP1516]|eukprot:XP_005793798.1 actin related protein 2/3 complex subunit 4 [Emiliania huxleyi CCMP1516]